MLLVSCRWVLCEVVGEHIRHWCRLKHNPGYWLRSLGLPGSESHLCDREQTLQQSEEAGCLSPGFALRPHLGFLLFLSAWVFLYLSKRSTKKGSLFSSFSGAQVRSGSTHAARLCCAGPAPVRGLHGAEHHPRDLVDHLRSEAASGR